MLLKDQVAVVTGGSRGIGRAIALGLAGQGAKVAVIYKGSKEAADALVQEIQAKGTTAVAIQADVADYERVKAVVEEVEKVLGPVNILVNNAGMIHDDLFVRLEPDQWNKVIQTNLGGTFNFCHAVAFSMMRRRSGRIINISSVAADYVNPGPTNYASSKGAINSFTRSLAVELAPRGVTVNALAPGFIETDMSAAVRNKAGDMIKKFIPMKRYGQPDDIANMAVFLAGPQSSYITGQVITIDGGLSLGAVGG
ncbi:MAG: 3-oxoacyl-ACP reductase family protein [Planctomycetia bacterium]